MNIVKFRADFPEYVDFHTEKERILEWISAGTGAKEVALFMIYRIWRDGLYLDGSDGYASFGDFVKEITSQVDISRSTIYARLRDYGLLDWLGYTEVQSIRMMSSRPTLYDKALSAIFAWDQDHRQPSRVKTGEFGLLGDPDFKRRVQGFLDSLESYDSIADALGMIKSDIEQEPTIRLWVVSANSIVVQYETVLYDADTRESSVLFDSIEFAGNKDMPEWVISAIKKKSSIS